MNEIVVDFNGNATTQYNQELHGYYSHEKCSLAKYRQPLTFKKTRVSEFAFVGVLITI